MILRFQSCADREKQCLRSESHRSKKLGWCSFELKQQCDNDKEENGCKQKEERSSSVSLFIYNSLSVSYRTTDSILSFSVLSWSACWKLSNCCLIAQKKLTCSSWIDFISIILQNLFTLNHTAGKIATFLFALLIGLLTGWVFKTIIKWKLTDFPVFLLPRGKA